MTGSRTPSSRRRLLPTALLLALVGCVQKAYDRTIVDEVDVSAVPNVQTVGVRGSACCASFAGCPDAIVIDRALLSEIIAYGLRSPCRKAE